MKDCAIIVRHGDSREVLREYADDTFDACVTDPPYALAFMGQSWDTGNTAHDPAFWREVYRVLKPGAHLVAFGGTRTYHRLACAIEDAGFEIRDCIAWMFGQGFPKSHDVSKALDRAAGQQGQYGAKKANLHSRGDHVLHEGWKRPWMDDPEAVDKSGREYSPATDSGKQWNGWGTALKPALEPIVLARKPFAGTVAENVAKYGTGALNIDACRIATEESTERTCNGRGNSTSYNLAESGERRINGGTMGRWPANVCHSGSAEVIAAFPESVAGIDNGGERGTGGIWQKSSSIPCGPQYGDSGSAARFFFSAKADADDRLGSKHPTIKPVSLMRWLVRLVCRRGGLILDPFAGTGTAGEAAFREGMRAVLIEREARYVADIERRISLLRSGPDERARETVKAQGRVADAGPLFAGLQEAAE